MNEIQYPARITQEGNDYLIQFVDLHEAHTHGKTLEEALYNASEVLSLCLAGRIEEEQVLPEPLSVPRKHGYLVSPAAEVPGCFCV